MKIIDDKKLILALGGPSKVAELLGFNKNGGTQRVQNWMRRGIPAAILVEYPNLFQPALLSRKTDVGMP